MDLLRSLAGIGVLLLIAFLFSVNKRKISLRTVGAALLLQVALGAIMLYIPAGKWFIQTIASGVNNVIAYSDAGSSFIFGSLVGPKMDVLFDGAGFIFAFRVLPAIIFITSLIAILYYLGIMQLVIKILGGGLQKLLGTSRTESLSATANIFVGQTEAPLVVRPYIS
ncbi:NupC/NupG family nucleoside CNT transporter, partial [Escherichia coli]